MNAQSGNLTTKEYWSALAILAMLMILPPTQVGAMGAVLLAPFALLVSWAAGLVFGTAGRAVVMALYMVLCGALAIRGCLDWLAG